MSSKTIILISTLILLVVALTQLTFFIIQPIGAVPKGKTIVMLRLNKTKLVDSADAMCEREIHSVNLLCRGMMMGAVLDKATILVKLPYSETLYNISTDGKTYRRKQ